MRPDRQLCEQVKAVLIASQLIEPGSEDVISEDYVTINYLPRFEPADLTSTKVIVAPRSRNKTPLSRVSQRRENVIQVAVMRKCEPNTELFENLLDFVEQIEDALANDNNRAALISVPRVGSYAGSSTDLYDITALEQHSVFRSVITINYLILK